MNRLTTTVLVLLLLSAVFATGCVNVAVNNAPENIPTNDTIKIDSADQTCQVDDDCVMAMVKCSCDCGVPINKLHWQKYLDKQAAMCKSYNGPMCKMNCDNIAVSCVNNTCTIMGILTCANNTCVSMGLL